MPEPIKETPDQMAMRLEQERVRKEQYERNKREKLQTTPTPEFGDTFIFRLKMWKNGPFSGLWQLEVLNKYGKPEELISDADTLPNALEAVGNIFANRGF